MNNIVAYTDGACSGNPGPGGWGVVLRAKVEGKIVRERLLSGGCKHTTNNRMELRAALEALKALRKPSKIIIVTDSTYVKEGLNNWIKKWKSNGWRTANNKPIKNEDLWKLLDVENRKNSVTWQWIKGHAGHEGNELADKLATDQVIKTKQAMSKPLL